MIGSREVYPRQPEMGKYPEFWFLLEWVGVAVRNNRKCNRVRPQRCSIRWQCGSTPEWTARCNAGDQAVNERMLT